jgi:uncharacterized membrane protein YqiK
MQGELAQANVSIEIETSRAKAATARAQGEAAVITTTGQAEASRTQAIGQANAAAEQALGLARAKGFAAQRQAIGAQQTALVAALREVGTGQVKIVPDIQVSGESGVLGGIGALLMRTLNNGNGNGNGSSEPQEEYADYTENGAYEGEPEAGAEVEEPAPADTPAT